MTDREREFFELDFGYAEGIDYVTKVVLLTGRELRKNKKGKWEAQPHNDNYWREFDDVLDAAKFALGKESK